MVTIIGCGWMHTQAILSSEASEDINGDFEGVAENGPGYLYTARTSDLTSRHGGWSKSGMLKYNELYLKVKEEQVANNDW
jgi:hypothetical protein